jgi:hypothetical protein
MDLLSEHAADLVPLEMPWSGMQREPLTLWHTPYRHLRFTRQRCQQLKLAMKA